MSKPALTNDRPPVPGGDLIYTQTPTPQGLLTEERPGQEDSWELGSQEEALPDAGNAVSVHADGTDQNVGSAATAAEKMNAQAQNQAPAGETPKVPNIALHATVYCIFTSLVAAGSGTLFTLMALDQLPANSSDHKRQPGEFETSVTLAVGFFASAIVATGSAIACGVRYCRERDSQAAAVATV